MGKVVRDFKQADPTQLNYEELEPWIVSNSNGPASQKRVHHMVKHFFGYLSGQSVNTPNPHPILKASPFEGRGIVFQDDDAEDETNIVVYTAEECSKLLEEATRTRTIDPPDLKLHEPDQNAPRFVVVHLQAGLKRSHNGFLLIRRAHDRGHFSSKFMNEKHPPLHS